MSTLKNNDQNNLCTHTWVHAQLSVYMHTDTATDQKINIHK